MITNLNSFFDTAKSLARNPLGIIALFIVLVYGIAALVTASGSSFTATERLPLIYFMVVFPVIVLGVFTWLVSQRHNNLYAPGDFQNAEDFFRAQMTAAASLVAASGKGQAPAGEAVVERTVDVVQNVYARSSASSGPRGRHILWVDDKPENNAYERQAFEAYGLRFTLASSTDEAFQRLSQHKYVAIISDMGRDEGPREGYVLLGRLREQGCKTPVFFYTATNAREDKDEATRRGGQGYTNNAQDLFQMVMKSVVSGATT
jgi:CheY-like chemotaxis protein